MEMTREFRNKCQRVVDCLSLDNKIYGIGGSIYSNSVGYVMSTTDLYDVVRALGTVGISVERTDSGGTPTWMLS